MIKKGFMVGLLFAFFVCSLSVNAEQQIENVKIEYIRAEGTVSISGEIPAAGAETTSAQLMVLKPGTDTEKLYNGELSFADCGIHADETELTDKTFAFPAFTMPAELEAGDYIVRIASDGCVYEDVIYFATAVQTLEILNQAADAEAVKNCILRYNDVYGLDLGSGSVWEQLPSEGQTYVCESLLSGEFATAEALQKDFDIYTLLYQIKNGPWGTLEQIIQDHSELLGLNKSAFNDLTNSQKDEVYKALVGTLYKDASDFADAFDRAVEEAENESGGSRGSSGGSSGGGGSDISMQIGIPGGTIDNSQEEENTDDGRLPFSDLQGYDWAKGSICLLYEKGIVNGRTDSEFAPAGLVTREEAVKMIVLALGGVDESAECSFSDISKDDWSYPYLATAEQKGIISGYGNGMSGASDYVTREDLAVMIVRAASLDGKEFDAGEPVTFGDADAISSYAEEAVQKLSSAGVISGTDENLFLPKDHATRAQTAKILAALIN